MTSKQACALSGLYMVYRPWSPMSIVSRENGPMRTKFEWKSSHLIGYLVKSPKKIMTMDAQSTITGI